MCDTNCTSFALFLPYQCCLLYFYHTFDVFYVSSEIELEQVLTTYTKINKSASIFLGSKKTESTNSNTSTGQGRPVTSQKQANNMHGVIVNGAEGKLLVAEVFIG